MFYLRFHFIYISFFFYFFFFLPLFYNLLLVLVYFISLIKTKVSPRKPGWRLPSISIPAAENGGGPCTMDLENDGRRSDRVGWEGNAQNRVALDG